MENQEKILYKNQILLQEENDILRQKLLDMQTHHIKQTIQLQLQIVKQKIEIEKLTLIKKKLFDDTTTNTARKRIKSSRKRS